MTGEGRCGLRHQPQPSAGFQLDETKNHTFRTVRVSLCASMCNFEAVIETLVCAGDGATGWQDGGPSLTGKPEQEE